MTDQGGRPEPGPAAPAEAVEPAGEPVNGFGILRGVVGLRVSTWRYHWEAPGVRHLGPMAQDWAATFGLGENDKTISMVDANGVALVSIQALHRLVEQLRAEVAQLRARLDAAGSPPE